MTSELNIIEQAEADLKSLRSEIERLRVAGDLLAAVVRDLGPGGGWDKAIDAWEEVRLG